MIIDREAERKAIFDFWLNKIKRLHYWHGFCTGASISILITFLWVLCLKIFTQ